MCIHTYSIMIVYSTITTYFYRESLLELLKLRARGKYLYFFRVKKSFSLLLSCVLKYKTLENIVNIIRV